jgi:trehalose synthase
MQHCGTRRDAQRSARLFTVSALVGTARLGDYAPLIDAEDLAAMRERARPLAGLHVLHLSASPLMSAVAETLRALVPLQRELGIRADWLLVGDLSPTCTLLYEGLRGDDVRWGARESAAWHQIAGLSASTIPPGYDVIVIHDPQLLALHTAIPGASETRWLWHCHLDPTGASPELWADVRQTLEGYTAALFPSPRLLPDDLPVSHLGVAAPVLDPGSVRNRPLPVDVVRSTLVSLGIDPIRPLLGQFAPIDHRFAPLAALGTYWLARREAPGLQIVLAETAVTPAFRRPYGLEQVTSAAAGDPDIHLFPADAELGSQEINALQRGCTLALQVAVPRGFGWGIAECQWKRKPAIVGAHGELPTQVADGSGYVVDAAPAAAERALELIEDPELAGELGARGHHAVARRYLITRLSRDYVELLRAMAGRTSSPSGSRQLVGRVP